MHARVHPAVAVHARTSASGRPGHDVCVPGGGGLPSLSTRISPERMPGAATVWGLSHRLAIYGHTAVRRHARSPTRRSRSRRASARSRPRRRALRWRSESSRRPLFLREAVARRPRLLSRRRKRREPHVLELGVHVQRDEGRDVRAREVVDAPPVRTNSSAGVEGRSTPLRTSRGARR